MQDWRRRPGQGRYARPERERRFLLRALPPTSGDVRMIEDRYIHGTRLRLRRVTVGDESVWKLTQKVRVRQDDPGDVRLTNTYLDHAEYLLLAQLPASALSKTRRTCLVRDVVFVVDEFHGHLAGLRLAEVEVGSLHDPLPDAPWLGREVSGDDRYSGGCLAAAGPEQVEALLGEVGQGRPPRQDGERGDAGR